MFVTELVNTHRDDIIAGYADELKDKSAEKVDNILKICMENLKLYKEVVEMTSGNVSKDDLASKSTDLVMGSIQFKLVASELLGINVDQLF